MMHLPILEKILSELLKKLDCIVEKKKSVLCNVLQSNLLMFIPYSLNLNLLVT